jgi:hypothetical protein
MTFSSMLHRATWQTIAKYEGNMVPSSSALLTEATLPSTRKMSVIAKRNSRDGEGWGGGGRIIVEISTKRLVAKFVQHLC